MRLSYLASFVVVVIGVLIGWNVTSVNAVVVWIVSGLVGRLHGFERAEVVLVALQRLRLFLGHGHGHRFRAGHAADCREDPHRRASARILFHQYGRRLVFPLVLAISLIGCLLGTLLTKPETMKC